MNTRVTRCARREMWCLVRWLAAVTLWWWLMCCAARAQLCAVRDLGLKPGDPNHPNARLLNDAIRAGKIIDEVHFPGGIYYANGWVSTHGREGLRFTGGGISQWLRNNSRLGASVWWVDNRTPEQIAADRMPAWDITSLGTIIDGVNIFRHDANPGHAYDAPAVNDGSVGVRYRAVGVPTGKGGLRNLAIGGFEIGIDIQRTANCDSLHFGQIKFWHCAEGMRCDNEQTTCILVDHLSWYPGSQGGRIVLNFLRGGSVRVNLLELIGPSLVLRKGFRDGGSSGDAQFEIGMLKVDPLAGEYTAEQPHGPRKGWRLLEAKGPVVLRVRGEVGRGARMGEVPILLLNPNSKTFTAPRHYQQLDVELWCARGVEVADGAVAPGSEGCVWRPRAEDWVR